MINTLTQTTMIRSPVIKMIKKKPIMTKIKMMN